MKENQILLSPNLSLLKENIFIRFRSYFSGLRAENGRMSLKSSGKTTVHAALSEYDTVKDLKVLEALTGAL